MIGDFGGSLINQCGHGTVGDGCFYYHIWYCFNMSQLTIGAGLDNLGNTCFFNATLQSILHTRPLATILAQHHHSHSCRLKQQRQWCCFCEMESVFTATRQARRYSPHSMINHLKSIFKKFKLGRQEDSHEFLRYLIEGMQEAETGKLVKEAGKEKQAKEALEAKIKASRVFDVFGGVIKTSVECLNCNHRSITTERYYDFNIECQRSNTLLEGIASFFAVDKLEGNNKYLCEHCKNRSNARKRFLLDSIPQVATFQLKRFTNSLRKIGKFIQFPLTIDLGRHLETPHKALMKLYAIVVHSGGSSYSGHYYAFVRVGDDWFKMDDGYVSKCSQQSVLSQTAYLLFYEKVFEELVVRTSNQPSNSDTKPNKVSKPNELQEEVTKQTANGIKTVKNEVSHKVEDNKVGQKHPLVEESPNMQISNPKQLNGTHATLNIAPNITLNGTNSSTPNSKHQLLKAKNDSCGFNKVVTKEKDDWSADEPINGKQNKAQEQKQQQEDEVLKVPGSLKRTRSKQEMERSLTHGELIRRTVEKLIQLDAKMPHNRPHNRSQRHIYNLRKYETVMQKRRKIG